jgi:predicted Rossmann fold flavoprotein
MKDTRKSVMACDCAVIGGGAAGMMAAIAAATDSDISVVIIEHTKRLGSKLLQTGNGKCNFTNLDMSRQMYQNADKEFVWNVIEKFDVTHTLDFFKSIGVYHKVKNGYVYPNSETAASLQDALRLEVAHRQIQTVMETTIHKITCDTDKMYYMDTDQGIISAHSVILATGSKAAPKTGSDGSGYQLATQLGHTVNKPLPALVQLVSDDVLCKAMAGVRSTGSVEIYVNNTALTQDTGEIQYTDYGISGIPVFQISRYAVGAVDLHKKVKAIVDMLPEYTLDEIQEDIRKRIVPDGYKTVEQFFCGLLNKKLVLAVAKRAGVSVSDPIKQLGPEKILRMANIMKQFELRITSYKSFENAQICQGGVDLKDISSDSMQSTLHHGLFFAGEVLDVDGKCGGYNLQWAWSSGHLAGTSVHTYLQQASSNKKQD